MSIKGNKELIRQIIKDRNELGVDIAKLHSWSEKYCAPGSFTMYLAREI